MIIKLICNGDCKMCIIANILFSWSNIRLDGRNIGFIREYCTYNLKAEVDQ